MKITYERLNQIIEEEVVKFKVLNEQVTDDPQSLWTTISGLVAQHPDKKTEVVSALKAIINKIKPV